ncbi:hypothetical protein [Aquabacterium sp.]|uniref:hypothetical protein n=1 Tax=Aquabacterium sp. TaxID=1872578 RepID=UPI002E32A7BF|nr:hypothetical protein [Aquabacterium sp.]HEX5312859.1 hypothetical protein [Aquabacterium sp.]
MSAVVESVKSAADEAWASAVGGWDWVKSLILGEFQDNRPLSVLITEMLVTFVPGVVIVTSARDAVAVSLRLAKHPERREHVTEWIVLCACLITIALPLAMAAGGALFAGVGAVVGGIAGSELGAALRAVMLMLAREAAELMEIVKFLQKFVTGNIMTFLKAVKFVRYEKAIIQALTKVTDPLIGMCKATRLHLEQGLNALDKSSTMSWLRNHFDAVKNSSTIAEAKAAVAKLAGWEAAFYGLQRDAVKKIPLALAELDARLSKMLAQSVEHDAHTVASGVKAEKPIAATPMKQEIADTASRPIKQVEAKPASAKTGHKPETKTPTEPPPPKKERPEPPKKAQETENTKARSTADALAMADKARITQLSEEAAAARKAGNEALAAAKIEEARSILRPHLPKHPNDSWDEVIKRLDVSSPKDGAVFWSGDPKAAQKYAEQMGGVTLETTSGGRIIDGWEEVNSGYAWDARTGEPPHARDLWAGASRQYAEGAYGEVNTVQTADKLKSPYTLWQNVEKPVISDKMFTGEVSGIKMNMLDDAGNIVRIDKNEVADLLNIKGIMP